MNGKNLSNVSHMDVKATGKNLHSGRVERVTASRIRKLLGIPDSSRGSLVHGLPVTRIRSIPYRSLVIPPEASSDLLEGWLPKDRLQNSWNGSTRFSAGVRRDHGRVDERYR